MTTRNAGVIGTLCLLAASLVGCAGAATNSIKGKVIEGSLNFVMVVDQSDERLKGPGLADVAVEARAGGNRAAGTLFSKTTSGSNGEFRLNFGDQQQVLLKPVEFSGEKAGYGTAKVVMNLPPSERRLLIVMQPSGPVHPATTGTR